jgi:hypothetical protein
VPVLQAVMSQLWAVRFACGSPIGFRDNAGCGIA